MTGPFDVNHIVFESAFPIANKHRNNGNKTRQGERSRETFSTLCIGAFSFPKSFEKVGERYISLNQIFHEIKKSANAIFQLSFHIVY